MKVKFIAMCAVMAVTFMMGIQSASAAHLNLEMDAALNEGDVEKIKQILAQGLTPDELGETLQEAAGYGYIEIVRLLLECGAGEGTTGVFIFKGPSLADGSKYTQIKYIDLALSSAQEAGNQDIVQLIEKHNRTNLLENQVP